MITLPPLAAIALFIVVISYELYLFMMQRSALSVSRDNDIEPKVGRQMLPLWYSSVWIAKIAKYFLVYQIYRSLGLIVALVFLAIPFILSASIPIPHRHFFPIFRKRLKRDLTSDRFRNTIMLIDAIEETENRYLK